APGTGVKFCKTIDLKVKVFSDADWEKCPVTRKSISGFVVMIRRCLVSWKSKKHPTISKSSTEDEYKCLAASTCEIASNPVFHE
ncbi:ribonuclease H-like domain-containing protein, partial [Tanacetum coccineum]